VSRPTFLTAYRWEMRKLRSQKRTYLGLGAAMIVPILFTVALHFRSDSPNDVQFGRYVHESGLAIPLVLLLFGSIWLFPLITALVAGDIVASEDHNGTLKTILTRSLDRGEVFAGKALAAATYALIAIGLMGTVAVVAGSLQSGFNPLVDLSGQLVSAQHALLLVVASFGVYMLPILALVCIGLLLSTVTRNSAAAVVGTLMFALFMQLIAILPGLGGVTPYLLSTQLQAWQGFFRVPTDWEPIVRGLWVSAAYGLPALFAAYLVFLRRDVTGGEAARIRLLRGLCSTSASPSSSSSGGMYMPKRPRSPFLRPYQPPTGLSGERPQASTVPSLAGFCSSALPSSIQSPCATSIACRSSIARAS
jgi:ABC-2 type transport system permease protein